MSTIIEQASALLGRVKGMSREDAAETLKAVPAEVKKAYYKLQKDALFVPENKGKSTEYLSPSGVYKLVVTAYATSPGCWGYTQGIVYKVGSDTPIAEIRRNYSSFPHLFIEGHPNGHSYLVGGEDYQGQTIVELDTGKKSDSMSRGANVGGGFCWAQTRFDAPSRMLVVAGCIWACPYEYRFFDFADPMVGWPEIESEVWIEDDERWPEFRADGSIVCFQLDHSDNSAANDDEEEEVPPEKRPVAATRTFRREGLKLKLVAEDVTEKEQKRRAAQEEAERRYEEWEANFKATDPLYLAYVEAVKDTALTPESYEGRGYTFKGWCPDAEYDESRWCRRIVRRKDNKGDGYTVDLEWGVKTGPVKLVVYKAGDKLEDKFFPHSVEGMHAAFTHAKLLVQGASS